MKKCFLIFACFLSIQAYCQPSDYKNKVKLNLSEATLKTVGIQYEKLIGKRLGVNINGFFRPQVLIPFGVKVDSFAKNRGTGASGIKFKYIEMSRAKVGINGINPELKYYFGKTKNKNFVSVFAQNENYKVKVPASLSVKYSGQIAEVTTPINFTFSTYTAGIGIGKSFQIGDRLVLDLVYVGPYFGQASKFNAQVNSESFSKLNDEDRIYLKDKIIERFGLYEKYFDVKIDETGAKIVSIRSVPYINTHFLGFNLGFEF